MLNHWPLIGRTAAKECDAKPGDTANPWAHITCATCRAKLANKVAAEMASAALYKPKRQERRMHIATAARFQRILDGDEVVASAA